jgi:hypothetical protein
LSKHSVSIFKPLPCAQNFHFSIGHVLILQGKANQCLSVIWCIAGKWVHTLSCHPTSYL